jgi:branched-chain amino acid transport system permease protein
VPRLSALAFATGGAIMATAGTLVSMFLSFNASVGIVYTLKALIVVIMGGVGRMLGCLLAGLLLGLAESIGAWLVDPGLTLAINFGLFALVLLIRPQGLFTRA